jgi:hypothetical protein
LEGNNKNEMKQIKIIIHVKASLSPKSGQRGIMGKSTAM